MEEPKQRPDQHNDEREEILEQLEDWIQKPMLILGLVWLVLLFIELTWGLGPVLSSVTLVIWILFLLEFILKLVLAPHKSDYVRHNWLTVISLLVPAVRILLVARFIRVLHLASALRGMRLVKIIASLNRGMNVLRNSLKRRGFGYITILTILVTLVGAAGMYEFERGLPDGEGLNSYGDALWWTAMIMTTLGSQYWPQTPEGRVLGFLLSLYAFSVFGYFTATLASFFIGRDVTDKPSSEDTKSSLEDLRNEITSLRDEIRAMTSRPPEH